jgi:acyl carrier protein
MDEKLIVLMADIFRIRKEEVTDSLAMKDVATWDSLKHMELIVSIEHAFGIELSFDEIVAMQNVKEIKRILKERGLDGKDDTQR